jgi:hypothetical protein
VDKRDEQSIDALKLYYQQDLSQAEVAARLGISRPTVAKLLAHGRDRGFVTISIHDPRDEASELAARLERCYGLSCVRVAHGHAVTEDEAIDQVGRVGADLVSQLVHDGMSVGISWGRTMSAVASYLTRSPRQGVRVVQLKGGTSFSARATHDFEVMRAFCKAFTAQPRYLPLPVIFQSTKTASIVCKDQAIMKILEEGRNVDVAVFTIGAISNEVISLNLGHLGEEEVDTLLHRAVGDALSHFFTESGQVAIPELEARTVSISLEHLRTRPVRLVVAGGNVKMCALDTALRMGIATHLVVDQDLAAALLDMRERDVMKEVGDGARDVEHLSI